MTASRQSSGAMDPLVIVIAVVFAVALVGFWPVMVWHGHGGPTGNDWRWDIHSTIAEAVYLGTVVFVAGMIALGCREPRTVVPPPVPDPLAPPVAPPPQPAPPACRHPGAVPVDLSTGERACWWCPDCETQIDDEGKPL